VVPPSNALLRRPCVHALLPPECPLTAAETLLPVMDIIDANGEEYGISPACLEKFETQILDCLPDLGMAEGCCSPGCTAALQVCQAPPPTALGLGLGLGLGLRAPGVGNLVVPHTATSTALRS
jgi:hypothetical protein